LDIFRRQILKAGMASLVTVTSTVMADGDDRVDTLLAPSLAKPTPGLRLVSVRLSDETRVGVVTQDGQLIDLLALEARHSGPKRLYDPRSMISVIASGAQGRAHIEAGVTLHGEDLKLPWGAVKLLSPIPEPRANIYAVGWNYLDHFEEGRATRADKVVKEYPTVPVFFSKATGTMNGPFDEIPYDASVSTTIDWESELAVVIGKKGRNIPESEAMDYVFGYSCFNDTTARDIQQKRHSGQWFKGKSLDGHGPMGPWIVTRDGVNLEETRVICRVNGIEKQNASYLQMYFKIPVIISELSRGLTLMPGDIIATGTPAGVGYSRNPPEFLKPGDVVESEVSTIGVIRNVIA
jgi:2-keto-4-pentenoate hydratase/2-oxohepta-3-ene-1,7-dioic acid hydratase in catechol pathway